LKQDPKNAKPPRTTAAVVFLCDVCHIVPGSRRIGAECADGTTHCGRLIALTFDEVFSNPTEWR